MTRNRKKVLSTRNWGPAPVASVGDLLSCSLTHPKCGPTHPPPPPFCAYSLHTWQGQRRPSLDNKTKLPCGSPSHLLEKLKCVRWLTLGMGLLCVFLNRLVGDILLCTGFLSYLGPFNQIFRNYLLKDQWEIELRARKIPFTENLNLISMLVDPPTVSCTFLSIFEFVPHFIS